MCVCVRVGVHVCVCEKNSTTLQRVCGVSLRESERNRERERERECVCVCAFACMYARVREKVYPCRMYLGDWLIESARKIERGSACKYVCVRSFVFLRVIVHPCSVCAGV